MLVWPTQAEGELLCPRLAAPAQEHLAPPYLCPLCVAQNPNVAFDFDHWEECEEDSPFSKGEMGRPCSWGRGLVQGKWVDRPAVLGSPL